MRTLARRRLLSVSVVLGALFVLASVALALDAFPPPDDVAPENEPKPLGATATLVHGRGLGLNYELEAFHANQGGICLTLKYSGALHGEGGACGFDSVPRTYSGDLQTNAIVLTVDELPPVDGTIISGVVSKNVSSVVISVKDSSVLQSTMVEEVQTQEHPDFQTNFFVAVVPGTGAVGTVAAKDEFNRLLQTVPVLE